MNAQIDTTGLISADSRAQIDAWLEKYPPEKRQSAVLHALHVVQVQNGGWVSRELMDAVADYLGMPRVLVYEVGTFYSMIELEPVGRHMVALCTNISCMLCGAESLVEHVEKKQTLTEFDAGGLARLVGGNTHHPQVIAENLDPAVPHTLEIEPLLAEDGSQELRLESICVAGGEAKVWKK